MKTPEQIAESYRVRWLDSEYTEDEAQDVADAIAEAIKADRAQHYLSYARSIIDQCGGRAVIWDPSDIDSMIDEEFEDTLPEGDPDRETLRARVMESWWWRGLDDVTEDGWESIRAAVREEWQAILSAQEADAVRTNTEEKA